MIFERGERRVRYALQNALLKLSIAISFLSLYQQTYKQEVSCVCGDYGTIPRAIKPAVHNVRFSVANFSCFVKLS
jgi:hypothetical protein